MLLTLNKLFKHRTFYQPKLKTGCSGSAQIFKDAIENIKRDYPSVLIVVVNSHVLRGKQLVALALQHAHDKIA